VDVTTRRNKIKMDFIVFVIILFCLIISWHYKKYHETLHSISKIPGPICVPLFGNVLLFFMKGPAEILKIGERLHKTYGKVFRVMLGYQVEILITDPKDIELLLGSQKILDKSDEYDFLRDWLGSGLLVSTGKKWHSRRKVITPAFHFKILDQFTEVFDKQSSIFVQNLMQFKGQSIDIFPPIALQALDVICGNAIH
jgi:cytochrome P450 family 4